MAILSMDQHVNPMSRILSIKGSLSWRIHYPQSLSPVTARIQFYLTDIPFLPRDLGVKLNPRTERIDTLSIIST